ncbi:MAG TPA: thrombospondin type 3 repeat-containing protein [Candidatus Nanoarchaeia archaeon]|nr:thrombospondin type 3 repeat-containing protein [Candidatus Nanoarchaeia archaeon]
MKTFLYLMAAVILTGLVAADNVLISEVAVDPAYNGDTSDAGKEYIELYNPTNVSIDISSWKVDFLAGTDVIIPAGTILPSHKFYLIGDTGGNGWPATWPTPDRSDNIRLDNTDFGVRLVNDSNAQIDAVGWGDSVFEIINPTFHEGTVHASDPFGHFERRPGFTMPVCGNWQDTNINFNDFIITTTANPQNSTSSAEVPCNNDTIPPSPITNLVLISSSTTSLTWEWDNPTDFDFSTAMVSLNGNPQFNTTTGSVQFTGLIPNTAYAISVKTGDISGNINNNAVSDTKSTNATPSGCTFNIDCSDGLFCNGVELCISNACQPGNVVNCNDGVSCTIDTCNEATDSCANTATNALCDNGLFCDGAEVCNAASGCQAAAPIDCSANDVTGIDSCTNIPDNNPWTYDSRNPFTATCDETNNRCTTGNTSVSSVCSLTCGAACETDADCGAGFECSNGCACFPSGQPYCGDGIINNDEECDTNNFGGATCSDYGFDSGSLACNSCNISITGCFDLDRDNDAIPDSNDNCIDVPNTGQADSDNDSIGDACDSCSNDPDNDIDQDTICGNVDNCPLVANQNQTNSDNDTEGDACDDDSDNDGIDDAADACPADPDNDEDSDGICGNNDNCASVANTDQLDNDNDSRGDACDTDNDNDNILNTADACPLDPQNDIDNDEVCGNVDNCPTGYNEIQSDTDSDQLGNACDVCMRDALNDIDSDTICGDTDYVTGTNVIGNICTIVKINNQSNVTNFNGLAHVAVEDCNGSLLAEFDYTFDQNNTLDLLNAQLAYQDSSSSSIKVSGIDLTSQNTTKTVYIKKVLGSNTICIKDSEDASISVDGDCSNGVKLACDGTNGAYTCTKINNGTAYKITGLKHSAAIEYSYSAPPQNTDSPSGGGSNNNANSNVVPNNAATVGPCVEAWSCKAWQACENSIQTRECADLSDCGTTSKKPSEEKSCSVEIPEIQPVQVDEPDNTTETNPSVTGSVVSDLAAGNGNIIAIVGIVVIVLIAIIMLASGERRK